jgi:hypothetical protein
MNDGISVLDLVLNVGIGMFAAPMTICWTMFFAPRFMLLAMALYVALMAALFFRIERNHRKLDVAMPLGVLSETVAKLLARWRQPDKTSPPRRSSLLPTARTHDYTVQGWGHSIIQWRHAGFDSYDVIGYGPLLGRPIRRGDFILTGGRNDESVERWLVRDIDRSGDPPDRWRATLFSDNESAGSP